MPDSSADASGNTIVHGYPNLPAGDGRVRSEPFREPDEEPWKVVVVVTAAGSGTRFGPMKKELASLGAASVLDRSVSNFTGLAGLVALVVTAPPGREEELARTIDGGTRRALGGAVFAVTAGGPSRRESVHLGLETVAGILAEAGIPFDRTIVLVHDGARPWAGSDLVARVLASASVAGACVPTCEPVDTPKELGEDGKVVRHLGRRAVGGAQTPQGFVFGRLLEIHRRAEADRVECTDDAELWGMYEGAVAWVPGNPANRKITFREDMPGSGHPLPACAVPLRIGEGWDLHRLVPGRKLLLGSVTIDSPVGEDAHSDGDVLWHAVIDALLGACALGDIGSHFPPSDPRWKDADSGELARSVVALLGEKGCAPLQIDCTIVLEAPRIGPYRERIRANLARVLGLGMETVSVKAKTSEGVDAVGNRLAVEARAVVLVSRVDPGNGASSNDRS